MSDTVQLSSKLPKDEDFNGADAIALDLIKDPDEFRVAIVTFDVSKITDQIDANTKVPTVRIRRFEPIGTVHDLPETIRTVMDQAIEKRTGRKPLPLDQVEPVELPDGDQ